MKDRGDKTSRCLMGVFLVVSHLETKFFQPLDSESCSSDPKNLFCCVFCVVGDTDTYWFDASQNCCSSVSFMKLLTAVRIGCIRPGNSFLWLMLLYARTE